MEAILDKVREEAFNLEREKKKYRTNTKRLPKTNGTASEALKTQTPRTP